MIFLETHSFASIAVKVVRGCVGQESYREGCEAQGNSARPTLCRQCKTHER
jgi:hypothetical protein